MKVQKIIQGCIAKEARYQRELVHTYSDLLYAICIRYMGDRHSAKDTLQQSLLKVLQKIETYDSSVAKLDTWMITITINTCLSALRKSRHSILSLEEATAETALQDESVIDRLSKEEILTVVSELPEGYRAVFNLYVIDGYNHSEIADMLDLSEEASRARLSRAKRILRKKLSTIENHRSWVGQA